MFELILVCIFLSVTVVILFVKLLIMKRDISEICVSFSEKLNSDTNTMITVSTKDKTIRKLANDINLQLKELKRQQNRYLRGDLELKKAVTNISHDLRTPLTAINSYLDLLDEEDKSENAGRYIDVIKKRTELMKQLTEELFRYSIISSPEYNMEEEDCEINRILEESILGFYAALKEADITPEIEITENKIVRTVNRNALIRIFSNVISNAVKYSDGDLKICLTDKGEITFSNTAEGLSETQVDRLFDRFYTVEDARKSTGLGLSIARILIEQMHGTISAKYENNYLTILIKLQEGV